MMLTTESDLRKLHADQPRELVTIRVCLPAELVDKAQKYAQRHGEAVSFVVEQALARALRSQRL